MKIRHGFVSNSSSSSFVCEVCGHSEVSYADPEDMVYCEDKAHLFCKEHLVGVDLNDWIEEQRKELQRLKEKVAEAVENDLYHLVQSLTREINHIKNKMARGRPESENGDGHVPSSQCPLCQMTEFHDRILLNYLMKKHNTDKKTITAAIRGQYKTYKDVQDSLS